ncbi:hypothetical protein [Sphingomonas colocasiae]|uniref:Iron transporter n=1 Tax=Sphingomonas colocasiae TaxID=1848973 RepID=A0ABS7PNF4_9SPHN|nr:hypothetical protein [Sphingomonas colocasiae]MBY8822801.1 hypothetical protein [Sphingomonas colocasiae]
MTPAVHHRLSLVSRIIAGAGGGYLLTSLIAMLMFLLLRAGGVARDAALLAPALASFLIYAAIVMAVFHARSAARAWLWIAGASLPVALLLLVLNGGIGG